MGGSRRPDDATAALALAGQLLDETLALLDVESARLEAVRLRSRGVETTTAEVLGRRAVWLAAVLEPLTRGELTPGRVATAVGQVREHRRQEGR